MNILTFLDNDTLRLIEASSHSNIINSSDMTFITMINDSKHKYLVQNPLHTKISNIRLSLRRPNGDIVSSMVDDVSITYIEPVEFVETNVDTHTNDVTGHYILARTNIPDIIPLYLRIHFEHSYPRDIFSKKDLINIKNFRHYEASLHYSFQIFQDADNTDYQIFGFGFGFGLRSNGGLLRLTYANGKTKNIPFDLSESKVHLSFTSTF